jgi:hypothetical protein
MYVKKRAGRTRHADSGVWSDVTDYTTIDAEGVAHPTVELLEQMRKAFISAGEFTSVPLDAVVWDRPGMDVDARGVDKCGYVDTTEAAAAAAAAAAAVVAATAPAAMKVEVTAAPAAAVGQAVAGEGAAPDPPTVAADGEAVASAPPAPTDGAAAPGEGEVCASTPAPAAAAPVVPAELRWKKFAALVSMAAGNAWVILSSFSAMRVLGCLAGCDPITNAKPCSLPAPLLTSAARRAHPAGVDAVVRRAQGVAPARALLVRVQESDGWRGPQARAGVPGAAGQLPFQGHRAAV